MSNKQVLVYGVLESTNDLRSVFVGHIHFKNLALKKYSDHLTRLINQGGMLLQTYEDFLELSVKQLVDHLSVHPHYSAFYAALGIACHCHIHR